MAKHRVTALLICLAALPLVWTIPAYGQAGATEFKVAKVKSAGISLEYPSNWAVVVLTPKIVRSQRAITLKNNPKLGELFDEAAAGEALKHSKFSAADLEAKLAGRPSSIVGVQGGSGFTLPLNKMVTQLAATYKKAGATILNTSTVQVSGTRSARIDMQLTANASDGTPVSVRLSQLLAPIGGRSVLVSVAAEDNNVGATTIDHIMQSVRAI